MDPPYVKPDPVADGKAKREAAAALVEGRCEGETRAWGYGGKPLTGTEKSRNDDSVFGANGAKDKWTADAQDLKAENKQKKTEQREKDA